MEELFLLTFKLFAVEALSTFFNIHQHLCVSTKTTADLTQHRPPQTPAFYCPPYFLSNVLIMLTAPPR